MGFCFVDFERPDNYILKLEPRMSKFYNIYKHNLICLNWQNVNVDRFPQCCNISRVAILKFFGFFQLILLRKPLHFSLFNPQCNFDPLMLYKEITKLGAKNFPRKSDYPTSHIVMQKHPIKIFNHFLQKEIDGLLLSCLIYNVLINYKIVESIYYCAKSGSFDWLVSCESFGLTTIKVFNVCCSYSRCNEEF